jgi:hypothetical protein
LIGWIGLIGYIIGIMEWWNDAISSKNPNDRVQSPNGMMESTMKVQMSKLK